MMSSSLSSRLRKGGLALAAVLLVGVGVIYLTGEDSAASPRLESVAVVRGTVVSSVSAAGTTIDNGMRDLAFGAQGTVEKIYVSVGDKVEKGELLARIDDTLAKENYTAAKAALAAAEDALDNADSTAATGSTTGSTTGAATGATGSRTGAAAGSGSCETAAKPTATPAPTARSMSGTRQAGTSRPTEAPTTAPVDPTLPDRDNNPESRNVGVDIQIDQPSPTASPSPTPSPAVTPTKPAPTCSPGAQTRQTGGNTRGNTGGSAGTRQTGGAQTEAQLEANVGKATTDLAEAKEALAGVVIKAPVAGTVLSIAGTAATDYTTGTFITLGNLDKLQVKAMFTESDVGRLKVGQPAETTLATDQSTHPGTVSHIDPTATTTGDLVQYGVTITFDDHPKGLLLGQSVTVQVTTDKAENTLYVPARAVQTGAATVTLQNGRTQPVRTGLRSDLYIEITEGLNEGDRITLPDLTTTDGFPDSSFPGL